MTEKNAPWFERCAFIQPHAKNHEVVRAGFPTFHSGHFLRFAPVTRRWHVTEENEEIYSYFLNVINSADVQIFASST